MAESLPDLIARLRLDMSEAQAGVSKASAIGGAIGGALGGAVAQLAGSALASVRDFVSGSVDAFSQLEDSTAAAGEVYGDAFRKVEEAAQGASERVGISTADFIEASQLMGVFGKSAGLAGDDLAKFGIDMTNLAGDLASFSGKPTEQALEAVGAALRGESEPIRAFGVLLDDATLKARAMEMGIYSGNGALTQQQRVLAAQQEVLAQTSDMQGDFARTMDSTTNVERRLSAATENLQAKFGTLLAPAFTAARLGALNMVNGMSGALDTIIPKFQEFQTRASSAMSGLRDLLVSGDYTSALRDAFGWEEDSSIVDGLLTMREQISAVLSSFGDAFAGVGANIMGPLAEGFGAVLPSIMTALQPLGTAFASLIPTLASIVPPLLQTISAFSPLGLVLRALMPILPTLAQLFSTLATTVIGALTPLLPIVAQVAATLAGALGQALATLAPVVAQVAVQIGGMLVQAVQMVAPLLQMLGPIIMTLLNALMPLVPAVMSVVTALLPLVPIFLQLAMSLLPVLVQVIMALVPPIVQLVSSLAGMLAPILQLVASLIGGVLAPILQVLAGIIAAVVPPILSVVAAIVGGLVSALSTGISWITNIIGAIARFFGSLGQVPAAIGRFVSSISSGISSALSWFTQLPGRAVGAISSLGSRIAGVASSALSSMGSAISSGIGTVVGFLAGLPGRAVGAISSMVGTFRNAGRNIINALADGIRNAIGNVTGAISNVVQRVRDFLPFSPAKRGPLSGTGYSLYSGRKLATDLGRGIADRARDAERAARDMAGAVAGAGAVSVALSATGGVMGRPAGAAAAATPTRLGLRVFIGDTELRDMVRVEVDDTLADEAGAIIVGSV